MNNRLIARDFVKSTFRHMFRTAIVGAALFLAHPAFAASFDCTKAGTAVEKMICADTELSKLDEALGAEYARVLAQAADQKTLKTQQRAWLRETRDACADAACLKAAYEARMAVLAKTGGAVSGDLDDLPLGPPDAPRFDMEYIDFVMSKGAELDLCRGVERGLRQYDINRSLLDSCGIYFPEGDTDFQHVPEWRDLDPVRHMDLVKEIFYWPNMTKEKLGEDDWERQYRQASIVPEIFEKLWRPSEARIMALFDLGRVKLQINTFDIDNDGKEETVYRMNSLFVPVTHKQKTDGTFESFLHPVTFAVKQCPIAAPSWDDVPRFYLVEKHRKRYMLPSRNFVFADLNFFLYRGRTYIAYSGASDVHEILPITLEYGQMPPKPICQITRVRKPKPVQ